MVWDHLTEVRLFYSRPNYNFVMLTQEDLLINIPEVKKVIDFIDEALLEEVTSKQVLEVLFSHNFNEKTSYHTITIVGKNGTKKWVSFHDQFLASIRSMYWQNGIRIYIEDTYFKVLFA